MLILIVSSLGVELVHGRRIPVGSDLQLKDHPGVFAIGDIAAMTDGKTSKLLPALGATALQAGHQVGKTITRISLIGTLLPLAQRFDLARKEVVAQGVDPVHFQDLFELEDGLSGDSMNGGATAPLIL
jgi:NADH dehydrogenase FAD-containing subunit